MSATRLICLLCLSAPLLAGAAAWDIYGALTGKTLLVAPEVPSLPDTVLAVLPEEKTNAIARIEAELGKANMIAIEDGPHFVRLMPRSAQASMLTNAPLRGAALAQMPGNVPTGMINFANADLNLVLALYADIRQRTILRPTVLPSCTVTVKSRCPLTDQEVAYALDTMLAFNGLAVVDDGLKFVQVVPSSQRARAVPRAPSPNPAAKLLDPKKVPAVGDPGFTPPSPPVEREFERLQKLFSEFTHLRRSPEDTTQRLFEFYARLNDKAAEAAPGFKPNAIWFRVATPLTKEELLYAIETTFALNNYCVVPVAGDRVRLQHRSP